MQKYTFDSILLLGNHANLYSADIACFSKLPVQSLIFKKKNPFLENDPHQLLLGDVTIDYNGNYSLDELSFALSVIVNHNKKLKNTLIIGDPSELLYQAYVFAQTNQNPLACLSTTLPYISENYGMLKAGRPILDLPFSVFWEWQTWLLEKPCFRVPFFGSGPSIADPSPFLMFFFWNEVHLGF